MIPVRLIGGLHDGEVVKVDRDQVELVMRRNMPTPSARAMAKTFGLAESTVTVATTRYTRRVVSYRSDELVYFALEDLSDFEALQHALGP